MINPDKTPFVVVQKWQVMIGRLFIVFHHEKGRYRCVTFEWVESAFYARESRFFAKHRKSRAEVRAGVR
jgi:hypothetical protein